MPLHDKSPADSQHHESSTSTPVPTPRIAVLGVDDRDNETDKPDHRGGVEGRGKIAAPTRASQSFSPMTSIDEQKSSKSLSAEDKEAGSAPRDTSQQLKLLNPDRRAASLIDVPASGNSSQQVKIVTPDRRAASLVDGSASGNSSQQISIVNLERPGRAQTLIDKADRKEREDPSSKGKAKQTKETKQNGDALPDTERYKALDTQNFITTIQDCDPTRIVRGIHPFTLIAVNGTTTKPGSQDSTWNIIVDDPPDTEDENIRRYEEARVQSFPKTTGPIKQDSVNDLTIINDNWLDDREMLPKRFPEACIVRFTYQLAWNTQPDINDLSSNLVKEIQKAMANTRDSDQKPVDTRTPQIRGSIIFLAHGQALDIVDVALRTYDSEGPRRLRDHTAGVIALGSPEGRIANRLKRTVILHSHSFNLRRFGIRIHWESHFTNTCEALNEKGIPSWYFKYAFEFNKEGIIQPSNDPLLPCSFHGPEDRGFLILLSRIAQFSNADQMLNATHENDLERLAQLRQRHSIDLQGKKGKTPLHIAVEARKPDLVKWMLQSQFADVSLADSNGDTALHLAVKNPDKGEHILRLLLEQVGTDIRKRNSQHQTPLDLAEREAKVKGLKNWQNDRVYWHLTHRPFLLTPGPNTQRKPPRRITKPASHEAIQACKRHFITALEFFHDKGPLCERRSVHDLVYQTNRETGPLEVLDKAIEQALEHDHPPSPEDDVKHQYAKTKRSQLRSICRWFHIPSHNTTWLQDFILRLGLDIQPDGATWKTHMHETPNWHGFFVGPFVDKLKAHQGDHEIEAEMLCMPFLDFETTSARARMAHIIAQTKQQAESRRTQEELWANFDSDTEEDQGDDESKKVSHVHSRNSTENSTVDLLGNNDYFYDDNLTESQTLFSTFGKETSDGFSPQNRSREIAKELNIQAYLTAKDPLLVRRTLDQYSYHMLRDTEPRDRDQVVYRHRKNLLKRKLRGSGTASEGVDEDKEERRKVLGDIKVMMVDQLWLLYIPKDQKSLGGFSTDIVISCFPERWSGDPPDLLESMLNINQRAPSIKSSTDLMGLIITTCTSILDSTRVPEECRLLEYFESAIGKAANKETKLLWRFKNLSKKLKANNESRKLNENAKYISEFVNVDEEIELMIHVKDISDEISTIEQILKDQEAVLVQAPDSEKYQMIDENDPRERHRAVKANIKIFEKMKDQNKRTFDSLSHLLDLKQKQANAWEAHFARLRAEELGRQGTTLLIFTVVTVVFLPLSFMSSFLAIDVAEFPKNEEGETAWPLHLASSWLFGIAFAIVVPLILAAFNVTTVHNFLVSPVVLWLWGPVKRVWKKIFFAFTWLSSRISHLFWKSSTQTTLPEDYDKIPFSGHGTSFANEDFQDESLKEDEEHIFNGANWEGGVLRGAKMQFEQPETIRPRRLSLQSTGQADDVSIWNRIKKKLVSHGDKEMDVEKTVED